ncbi:MAG: hypothetical protein ACD_4C00084G0001 [uncultured bacterium (gcode 4)]|uniref:Uncharacterized protein n=1 Tax=uncultured bacterium (gcode 4) TaxID=1234023 RepID=K2FVQ1_9BACT|nr:MAG: hypothetical protein ACD_4C00084G0001 [uncultured bacterium (gcode 4)]
MKKQLLLFLTIISVLTPFYSYADTVVRVTEKIPWADCGENISNNGDGPESRIYECRIKPWFQSVMLLVWWFVKYATFIVALIWVLMLVASGIHLSLSWFDSGAKAKAKEHFTKIIYGLILLFLIWFILNTVAPWIYK